MCRYSGDSAQGLPRAQDHIRMVLEEAEVLHARVMAAFAKEGGAAGGGGTADGGGGGKGGESGGGGREETSSQYDAILRHAQAVLDDWQCVSWLCAMSARVYSPAAVTRKQRRGGSCRIRRRCWTTGTVSLFSPDDCACPLKCMRLL